MFQGPLDGIPQHSMGTSRCGTLRRRCVQVFALEGGQVLHTAADRQHGRKPLSHQVFGRCDNEASQILGQQKPYLPCRHENRDRGRVIFTARLGTGREGRAETLFRRPPSQHASETARSVVECDLLARNETPERRLREEVSGNPDQELCVLTASRRGGYILLDEKNGGRTCDSDSGRQRLGQGQEATRSCRLLVPGDE